MDKYFVASIAGANSLGNKRVKKLVEFFGSGRAAWNAEVADLQKCLTPKALEFFLEWRQTHPDAPEQLADYCERKGFGLCTFFDEDYPPLLRESQSSPPTFFYYRGKILPNVQRVGIVGTRHNTPYGKSIALTLGRELAAAGLTVVSGAARGIDTFAHTGALETGRTVAVLGHGLNWVYPRENKKLIERIAENGLVISEFSPNIKPSAGTFPTRNRIISGLCLSVVVVEAGEKSGALVTSNFAADDGRMVFSVPGNVYSEKSIGCHELIRDGATLIKNAQDVLEIYNLNAPKKISAPPAEADEVHDSNQPQKVPVKLAELSAEAAKVFELIPSGDFITDDEILNELDEIAPDELANFTLELDMKGYIVEDAGRYTRKTGG